jgi:hypothetical protein
MALRDFLMTRIESDSVPEPNTGCWLWLGSVGSHGYPQVNVKGEDGWAPILVHNALVNPPLGQHALHRCDVKRCVRPAHLYSGTRFDNMRDWSRAVKEGRGKGRGKDLRSRKRHAIA